ncbi:helicase HerA domain-containing protein [Streptomyces sp. Marseille-Q5077]|uniref:helicase HerA domain-containing protein n=1 Tax=Streptomyces sp. Marseille-Q5077 TaxID=3418995 RepID=UPI003D03A98A
MDDLIPGVGSGRLLEQLLLSRERAHRIGAVHRLDYQKALVLTHDRWKFEAGGIPQFCFLLATARNTQGPGGEDDEVLLLRVEGTAALSMEADLLAVREESLREALSSVADPSPGVVLDVSLDPFTRNRISFTGLNCRILGTFYEDHTTGRPQLAWGHDVDNFYATATYQVYKPLGEGLSEIASYLKPDPGHPVEKVRIGAVRYASTQRREQASKQPRSPVSLNVYDFIGHKTGMFGMTRMGKSNTMKTLVARTFAASELQRHRGEPPVGQLILDPQGEYANPNTQDGTEIAAIGKEHVLIYKFGGHAREPHVRPLGFNFYDDRQLDAVQAVIAEALSDSTADYIRAFLAAEYAEPARRDDETEGEYYQRYDEAARGRLILYAALKKAGFPPPRHSARYPQRPWRASVKMAQKLVDALELANESVHLDRGKKGWVGVPAEALEQVVDWLLERIDDDPAAIEGLGAFAKCGAWKAAVPIYTQTHGNRSVSGYTKLQRLKGFHQPNSRDDYRRHVYDALCNGKIVIVDLHLGPENVTRRLAEDCAEFLLERQTDVFTDGRDAPHIQVVLEEAHNLFTAQRYKDDLDVWVRLAKQASKLNLGMVYATQEVTGVAHQVLANTKNWVVAHLNNRPEVKALSQYYDFGAFADAIVTSEDRGYVRLKTMSSPYIVPVQIDRYEPELVNEARRAAGLPPLVPIPVQPRAGA